MSFKSGMNASFGWNPKLSYDRMMAHEAYPQTCPFYLRMRIGEDFYK